ncbi:MAG: glycosyltransferase family 4 protein [Candidatus Dormibacteria bacterium]
MTATGPEPGSARVLRLAWFGHALGRRADGLASYSSDVASGLTARGVELYFHHSVEDGTISPADHEHTVSWPTWSFKTVTVPGPGFRRRLRAWMGRMRPDVIHTSISFSLDDGWLAREGRDQGAATVATFHLPFGAAAGARAMVMRRLHRFWAPRLSAYQRVIVFTKPHRDQLAEAGVAPAHIVVLANAVDTERFSPGDSSLRRQHLVGAELVVGYLGRLDPEKGIGELLHGFASAELGRGARLLVAGGGTLEGRVRAAAHDPRVLFLGQLHTAEERADFWRAADVFCLPSSAEGLSLALLEAMASGCAVAATPAGGAASLGAAVTGLDAGHLADSVADALARWQSNPSARQLQGRRARELVVRHHGMAAMLDRLLVMYRECQEQLGSGG